MFVFGVVGVDKRLATTQDITPPSSVDGNQSIAKDVTLPVVDVKQLLAKDVTPLAVDIKHSAAKDITPSNVDVKHSAVKDVTPSDVDVKHSPAKDVIPQGVDVKHLPANVVVPPVVNFAQSTAKNVMPPDVEVTKSMVKNGGVEGLATDRIVPISLNVDGDNVTKAILVVPEVKDEGKFIPEASVSKANKDSVKHTDEENVNKINTRENNVSNSAELQPKNTQVGDSGSVALPAAKISSGKSDEVVATLDTSLGPAELVRDLVGGAVEAEVVKSDSINSKIFVTSSEKDKVTFSETDKVTSSETVKVTSSETDKVTSRDADKTFPHSSSGFNIPRSFDADAHADKPTKTVPDSQTHESDAPPNTLVLFAPHDDATATTVPTDVHSISLPPSSDRKRVEPFKELDYSGGKTEDEDGDETKSSIKRSRIETTEDAQHGNGDTLSSRSVDSPDQINFVVVARAKEGVDQSDVVVTEKRRTDSPVFRSDVLSVSEEIEKAIGEESTGEETLGDYGGVDDDDDDDEDRFDVSAVTEIVSNFQDCSIDDELTDLPISRPIEIDVGQFQSENENDSPHSEKMNPLVDLDRSSNEIYSILINKKEKSEKKSEEKSEDKSDDKFEEKSEDTAEQKSEEKSKGKSEDKSKDKSDRSEDKSDSVNDDAPNYSTILRIDDNVMIAVDDNSNHSYHDYAESLVNSVIAEAQQQHLRDPETSTGAISPVQPSTRSSKNDIPKTDATVVSSEKRSVNSNSSSEGVPSPSFEVADSAFKAPNDKETLNADDIGAGAASRVSEEMEVLMLFEDIIRENQSQDDLTSLNDDAFDVDAENSLPPPRGETFDTTVVEDPRSVESETPDIVSVSDVVIAHKEAEDKEAEDGKKVVGAEEEEEYDLDDILDVLSIKDSGMKLEELENKPTDDWFGSDKKLLEGGGNSALDVDAGHLNVDHVIVVPIVDISVKVDDILVEECGDQRPVESHGNLTFESGSEKDPERLKDASLNVTAVETIPSVLPPAETATEEAGTTQVIPASTTVLTEVKKTLSSSTTPGNNTVGDVTRSDHVADKNITPEVTECHISDDTSRIPTVTDTPRVNYPPASVDRSQSDLDLVAVDIISSSEANVTVVDETNAAEGGKTDGEGAETKAVDEPPAAGVVMRYKTRKQPAAPEVEETDPNDASPQDVSAEN